VRLLTHPKERKSGGRCSHRPRHAVSVFFKQKGKRKRGLSDKKGEVKREKGNWVNSDESESLEPWGGVGQSQAKVMEEGREGPVR